jgi:1-aminocyclopropane-1-carboxylate deaminase/D-cysteine desulfhydrase-like pyridoxal-dependent ACC family enzyme
VLVANGTPPAHASGNALLARLLGAEIRYVERRQDRAPAVEAAAEELRRAGRRPYVIPIGASTPLGAAAYVLALRELLAQIPAPDVIFHASSSGGTQAGLVAGCALSGLPTQVFGISADESAAGLIATVNQIIIGLPALAGAGDAALLRDLPVIVDDTFVGGGYGVPTDASREALELTARTEAIFLDPTYTAKAMAGLIAAVRQRWFDAGATVLFWHTGGQVALFA